MREKARYCKCAVLSFGFALAYLFFGLYSTFAGTILSGPSSKALQAAAILCFLLLAHVFAILGSSHIRQSSGTLKGRLFLLGSIVVLGTFWLPTILMGVFGWHLWPWGLMLVP